MKTKDKNVKARLAAVLCVIVVVPAVYFLVTGMEGEKPSISVEMTDFVGASEKISVSVSDIKSGIRNIKAGLLLEGKEIKLLDKDFSSGSILGFGIERIRKTHENIQITPKKLKISDGKAVLRVAADDLSWRNWFSGNRTYIEKPVEIDTASPDIEILSKKHNVTQGGSGVVLYKISEPCVKTGVLVGDNFFPGYPGMSDDKNLMTAFFALRHDQGQETTLFINAKDRAGNEKMMRFPHYIKRKRFKNDVINIPDRFLDGKLPEFQDRLPNGLPDQVAKFLHINREIRLKNLKKFEEIGGKTAKELLWDGAFVRLPKAARKASFADKRDYRYKGKKIDTQYHMGIDLASTANAPVPASNSGNVVFIGNIGIFGKTVVIDHGFGLMSTYSHLSGYNVNEGQAVSKGQTVGRTGMTGLAGGDHLHFGIMIFNTFVDPVEWWDGGWIKNNIMSNAGMADAY